MAVRFTATGQSYSSTSSPPDDPFTITCWARIDTDRNAISGIWGAVATTGFSLATQSDGTTLRVINTTGTIILGAYAMTIGTWYRFGVSVNGTAIFAHAPAGSALTSDSGAIGNVTGPSSLRIGSSVVSTDWWNGRIAAFKRYDFAMTVAEMERELSQYAPHRTAGLLSWHPFLTASTTDHSGNARTLTGSGATTEDGPPIPWSAKGTAQCLIPWDPATPIWYAVYDMTSGVLVSSGFGITLPLPSGLAYREYLNGQPDPVIYTWDTIARSYVFKEGVVKIDRVADLVADPTLTAAWAALTSPQSTAMQDRIGQMLGPFRYRDTAQDIDLQQGFGSPQ